MEKNLLVTDYAKVSIDIDRSIGQIIWTGNCTLEEYTACFNVLLDYQKTNIVKYFLSDIRNQGVMNPQNRHWFETHALPIAVRQGLLRAAVVTDHSIFKRYYLNLILQATLKVGLLIKTFDSMDKAIEWLVE